MTETQENTNPTPAFTKGQSVTVKLRGVSSDLITYKGQTGTVVRGGKTVTVGFENDFDYTIVRVPAASLATSVRK